MFPVHMHPATSPLLRSSTLSNAHLWHPEVEALLEFSVLMCAACGAAGEPRRGDEAGQEAMLASAWEAFHCHDGITACIGRAGDNRNALMLSYIVRAPPQLVAKVKHPASYDGSFLMSLSCPPQRCLSICHS